MEHYAPLLGHFAPKALEPWSKIMVLDQDGTLSSKTSNVNGRAWEDPTSKVNKAYAERNIPTRSVSQMKEKISNMKAEYKRICDKESQTGGSSQSKPEWFDCVDRVFGSRDE
ncbi:hypothetical protein AC249_AIPGENE3647 [Exaiptasia diaphana]|nr:hypothetical protein AC249_AIPGENE3647 [Exaiptasia diaphana]